MKISIIVPVYNTEKYLHKCLESLVNQTLAEVEIIVVNDGSTDGSQKIIDDFAQKYPSKIVPCKKANGGLSDARNFGIEKANGEFIGFVDSDDYVTKDMFEEMYALARKHAAQMVICNLQKVDQNGKITQKLTQIPNFSEKIVLKDHLSVFSDLSYFACNKIFSRELFKIARFKKGIHFEDIQLIPQLLLQCSTLAHTQKYHYQYLERTDSITKSHTLKGLDILQAVKDVEKVYEMSQFADRPAELKNFQILEGVYTFLAYLAFVKDDSEYKRMSNDLQTFMKQRGILKKDVFGYRRFGKNYFSSLPSKKKLYYFLYFFGGEQLLRKILR